MRSVSVTVRLPFPLHEALKQECQNGRYEHMHACIIGACIKFVQDHRRQKWVPIIANAKAKQQDFLLEKMLSFPTENVDEMLKTLKKLDAK